MKKTSRDETVFSASQETAYNNGRLPGRANYSAQKRSGRRSERTL